MTVNRPSGDKPGGVSWSRSGVESFDAGLEVVSSPSALWLRLSIAGILGSVFGGIGLIMLLSGVVEMADRSNPQYGSPLGPLAVGIAALFLGGLCFAGGWATYKSYRRRGLI